MSHNRITTFRLLAFGCAIMLLLFGREWAYGAAIIMLVIGGFGFYLLHLASRLEQSQAPDERDSGMFARSIWWLLVLGFVGSLGALWLVR